MENGGLSASDVALMSGNNGWGDGMGFMWIFALLVLAGGGFGFGNNGFANAIGYENLATSNEVQRGFDNQNLQAQTRDILAAVNAGTAQGVATTNQVFHDIANVVQDKYGELSRDVAEIRVGQANAVANQNECCCSTKMLISETAAQNRYDSAMNTQKILDALSQNKIESLQGQIQQLQLNQAMTGVVRYPMATTYTSGGNPFCGGCGCGNI
jgi:hypothetical protein